MPAPVRILGIAGSLRRASYNRAALQAATQLVPEGATLEIIELDGIPPFNQDEEQSPPTKVVWLKKRIREADAILIVTPEYNYSIPGVLKNAIDWASRPLGDSAWSGKPAAIMGASVGALGTARAQYHLRQIFVFLNIFPINQPEVMIGHAAERFDPQGNLTDELTKNLIIQLLQNLVDWTRRISGVNSQEQTAQELGNSVSPGLKVLGQIKPAGDESFVGTGHENFAGEKIMKMKPTTVSYSNPAALAEPTGPFSHVATAPRGLVAIAGQVAVDRYGNLVGGEDCGQQVEQVFENLQAALAEVGLSPRDLIQLTIYLVRAEDIPDFSAARERIFHLFFPDGEYPSCTLVVVQRLMRPEFLVEIQALAVLPD